MSSSSDLFGPEDFENLIAAVDSLDIPSAEESPFTPAVNKSTKPKPAEPKKAFTIQGDPFGNGDHTLSLESNEEDEFAELDNLASDYSELNFDDDPEAQSAFSPSANFAPQTHETVKTKPALSVVPAAKTAPHSHQSSKASFAVDDPFNGAEPVAKVASNKSASNISPCESNDEEYLDMYADFLEDTVQQSFDDDTPYALESSEKLSTETDDEFSELESLSEGQPEPTQSINYFAFEDGEDEFETFDGVAAANEISSLFSEESTEAGKPASPALKKETATPEPLLDSMAKTQQAAQKLKEHLASLNNKSKAINNTVQKNTESVQPAKPDTIAKVEHTSLSETSDEFSDISTQAAKLPNEPIVLSTRKTGEIKDTMLAAFVESTLSSKQNLKLFSLQNFALKFPKAYLACTAVLAVLGFVYMLAIPALLGFTMFNGFEMLNSPFTNSIVMLLVAMFSISLFLFMAGYKLIDLKFVGPGGITLNHENATAIIDKLQQLSKEHSIPRIHEVVLTRRHELNLIKIPRFGFPIWSKNVLAIGYPMLQTLPAEYFDVALTRRLVQFNKRKNMLHNWLSYMRRTWTIYAVSLKERKGVLDLLHYCFFGPYASLYRSFAVYVTQRDEIYADEKALHCCNDRDLVKSAQTIRITRAMLVQYFWPKLSEDLQQNMSAPHYVKPYSKLPETISTLLNSKNVDSWFIRLGQEERNPDDAEAPFALRMKALEQRKVTIPEPFQTNAAQHYFADNYEKMTELLDTLWAEEVQKALFDKNIHNGSPEDADSFLPCHLSIEPA